MKAFKLRNADKRSQEKFFGNVPARKCKKKRAHPAFPEPVEGIFFERDASVFPGKNHFFERARSDPVAVFLKQVIPGNAPLFIAGMRFQIIVFV